MKLHIERQAEATFLGHYVYEVSLGLVGDIELQKLLRDARVERQNVLRKISNRSRMGERPRAADGHRSCSPLLSRRADGTTRVLRLGKEGTAHTPAATANVAYGVTSITIEPTRSNSNATVAYLSASDTALADADVNKTGFQVTLAAAANTIKVKVTAEAGDPNTDTYTVVVTRAMLTPAETEVLAS